MADVWKCYELIHNPQGNPSREAFGQVVCMCHGVNLLGVYDNANLHTEGTELCPQAVPVEVQPW